jgi:hypothetical protein
MFRLNPAHISWGFSKKLMEHEPGGTMKIGFKHMVIVENTERAQIGIGYPSSTSTPNCRNASLILSS